MLHTTPVYVNEEGRCIAASVELKSKCSAAILYFWNQSHHTWNTKHVKNKIKKQLPVLPLTVQLTEFKHVRKKIINN